MYSPVLAPTAAERQPTKTRQTKNGIEYWFFGIDGDTARARGSVTYYRWKVAFFSHFYGTLGTGSEYQYRRLAAAQVYHAVRAGRVRR